MKRLFVALAIPLICSSAEAQNQSALPRKEAYTECPELHVTKSKFAPEIEDLSSFIQAEVGTNARQAEWSEIKSCFAKFGLKYFRRLGVRMQRIRDRPEDDESQMLVLVNGKRYFSPKTRAYFAAFHGGHLPRSFLPHDQVAGYQISLGSWFYPLRAFYVVEAKSGNAQPIAKPSPTSVDWEICRDPRHTKADLMATIAACSRLITSGDIRDRNLVTTYLWRALHLREAGELDRAISDYDSAIRLDPSRSSAYHERGSVFHTKGDYQRAIADYSEAIRLDPRNANAFNNRALAYRKLGDLDRAIRDYDASIRVEPNNPRAYGNRGVAYAARGDYDRAIADLSEAIRLDPHDPDIFKDRGAVYRENDDYERAVKDFTEVIKLKPNDASAFGNRGFAYQKRGDYDSALIDSNKSILLDPNSAAAFNNRGFVYQNKGDYDRAILDFKESIRLNPKYVLAYGNLALVYKLLGRDADARSLFERVLSLDDKTLAAEDLSSLADIYRNMGRYADAELFYKRALAAQENTLGAEHPLAAIALRSLGQQSFIMGRYPEAELLFKRALGIQEKVLGAEHSAVTLTLVGLAEVYRMYGRYAEAELLNTRALAVAEKAGSARDVSAVLNNLALIYQAWGRYPEAEALLRRALAIAEAMAVQDKALGGETPKLGKALANLAGVYRDIGRFAEAEPLYNRALTIMEKIRGPENVDVATIVAGRGEMYRLWGRYAEAELLLKRALVTYEKTFGTDNLGVALSLNRLAQLSLSNGRIAESLDYSRKAVRSVISRLAKGEKVPLDSEDGSSMRKYFDLNVAVLYRALQEGVSDAESSSEAFEIAQFANQSTAATALNQMAARFGAANDALAGLIRDQQDALNESRALDKALVAELSKSPSQRNAAREDILRRRRTDLGLQVERLNTRIAAEFPRYADLAKPKPLASVDVQKLLSPEEALVLFHVGEQGSFVWVLSRDNIEWHDIKLTSSELDEQVRNLRASLDVSGKEDHQPFNLNDAYSLYSAVLRPVETALSGKFHLILVLSGALTSLPFQVLVTEKPPAQAFGDTAYRSAAWLMRKYAVTVLPSISSLKALRELSTRTEAPQPYLGFGDPIFNNRPAGLHKVASTGVSYRGVFRGVRADIDKLSKALSPLPATADELRAVARLLGAPQSQIKLGKDATVSAVKTTKLDDFRILHFATHALVAGETAQVSEQAEPALALTLPQVPSDFDDGLLRSSEVATLKLNADWVILSACNTAAGDKPGAEALSGLARAFFYAGAKTLLVSHWPVESEAAVYLTTRTIETLQKDATVSPAEGLRRAMIALMNDQSDPDNANPGIWAPFVIVGTTFRPGT